MIGTSTTYTICDVGCLMTSVSMALNGKNIVINGNASNPGLFFLLYLPHPLPLLPFSLHLSMALDGKNIVVNAIQATQVCHLILSFSPSVPSSSLHPSMALNART